MTHDAHIQTALTAACQFGRAQYDARMRLENYDCSRAIAALNAMNGYKPEANSHLPSPISDFSVIGGGNSITGKIKWLLENRGAMTRDEMAMAMGADVNSVTNIVASLRNKKVLSVEGFGNAAKFSISKHIPGVGKMVSLFLALCLCASVVQAAQVTLGVQMAISAVPSGTQTLTTTSAETVAAGSIPIKYSMLKWQTGMSNFVVKVGASREVWTNQFTVSTNQLRLTNGLHYGICGVFTIPGVITNAQCAPVYWPSNRIDRIIVQTSTNLLLWADAFTWQTNYNKPQEFLRLRSELIRWE